MLSTHSRKPGVFRKLMIPGFCALLLGYFVFHAFSGNFGVTSRLQIENQKIELEYELALLRAKREELSRRVQLIKSGSLEKDMVDERARYTLSMIRPDEVIVYLDDGQ